MFHSFLKTLGMAVSVVVMGLTLAGMAQAAEPADKAEPAAKDKSIQNAVSHVAELSSETIYQDFESQIIAIFQALLDSKPPEGKDLPFPIVSGEKATKLLKTYLAKMQNHEMHIKNIVFRTDNRNIRVTFGDSKDEYLFKIAYSTSHDRVLVNSRYANKDQISDIKLIYYEDNKLNYIWIYHKQKRDTAEDAKKPTQYVMHFNMADERCGYCHELAKHDGSNTGLFFVRYQYKKQFAGTGLDKVNDIFNERSFVMSKKSDTIISKVLGDKMPDNFYFQRFNTHFTDSNEDQTPAYSTLLEMPELIEVLARDNGKSYCLSIKYKPEEFLTNENFICADVEKKKLYVHYENPWSVKWGKPKDPNFKATVIDYEKDFWDNQVMPYNTPDQPKDGAAYK